MFFTRRLYQVTSALVLAMLSACGGGGDASSTGGNQQTQPQSYTTAQARSFVQTSQTVYKLPTYDLSKDLLDPQQLMNNPAVTTSYRWNVERDGFIPVKITSDPHIVNQVLDELEATVGRKLFDRATLANTPDNQILRGLLIKKGVPPLDGAIVANNCGRFWADGELNIQQPIGFGAKDTLNSFFPDLYKLADYTKHPDRVGSYLVQMRGTVMVNSDAPNCPDVAGLYLHEISHALGLLGHFDGFGTGKEEKNSYLIAIKLLYSNPVGTPFNSLN